LHIAAPEQCVCHTSPLQSMTQHTPYTSCGKCMPWSCAKPVIVMRVGRPPKKGYHTLHSPKHTTSTHPATPLPTQPNKSTPPCLLTGPHTLQAAAGQVQAARYVSPATYTAHCSVEGYTHKVRAELARRAPCMALYRAHTNSTHYDYTTSTAPPLH
jgi:hypothetical protein